MSLDHILLGILHRPESGYSIKQAFDSVFSHFWAAEISQIYRHLKKLEERGFLASWEEPSAKGPPRRLYQRTKQGLAELREWLSAGPCHADRRVPYLSQVCFLAELDDPSERLAFFEALREHFAVRLKVLQDISAAVYQAHLEEFSGGLPVDEVCGQLTLNHGLHRAQAMVAWCDESLAILRQAGAPAPGDVQSSLRTLPRPSPSPPPDEVSSETN